MHPYTIFLDASAISAQIAKTEFSTITVHTPEHDFDENTCNRWKHDKDISYKFWESSVLLIHFNHKDNNPEI